MSNGIDSNPSTAWKEITNMVNSPLAANRTFSEVKKK